MFWFLVFVGFYFSSIRKINSLLELVAWKRRLPQLSTLGGWRNTLQLGTFLWQSMHFFTTIINVWWVKYCSKSHLDMDLNAFVIGYQQHERESRQNMTKNMKNKKIKSDRSSCYWKWVGFTIPLKQDNFTLRASRAINMASTQEEVYFLEGSACFHWAFILIWNNVSPLFPLSMDG